MNLSAPFILRPIMTTLLTLVVIVVGFYAYKNIPVSNLPDVNYPTITVTVPFPGLNPENMANTVATPLEKEFMTIPGIKSVTSTSQVGLTTIILQFEVTKNIDLAAVDVDAAIVRARPNLPPNLPQEPSFKKVNPAASPILYLILTSPTLTQAELYDYANTIIGQRISIIDGVASIIVYGSPKAVRAQVDPGLLASLGLTLQDISVNIESGNQYQPLGQFDGAHTALTIYDTGALYTAKEYEPIIVAYKNGAPVKIEDLGIVVDGLQNDRSYRRYIDRNTDLPSVTLAIQKQGGANAVEVADAINKLVKNMQSQLPGSLEMITLFDLSVSIRDSIADVEFTLLLSFILVVIVIYLYLGKLRETIIPAIIMPLSIIGTIAIIYQMGYTLDNLSLLALILAIGFIIDDAIVVLENIVRWMEGGENALEGSLKGSKQISFTIVSMTLSLLAVFIPLIFMAGIIGKLFEEFSMTLAIVTVLSGIISLTLTPMLCSRFLREVKPHDAAHQNFPERFNEWMLNGYKKGLSWGLNHRMTLLLIGVFSIILSIILFKVLPTDFIPNEDIGFVIAYSESEQGTSSDQMHENQNKLAELIKKEPDIESFLSISGVPTYRQGITLMRLLPRNERDGVKTLIQKYNKIFNSIPGLNVYLKNVPIIDLDIGQNVRANYQYLIQGLDSNELHKSSDLLLQKMRSDPTFQAVSTDLEVKTPQVALDIDRQQASALGIDVKNLETTLSLAFSLNRISRIQTPLDQYDVIVELLRNLQNNPSSLNYLYMRSSLTNQLVPLNTLATWKETVGPNSVNHFSQFPAVTISFNIAPNVALSEGLERLDQLATESFSENVHGQVKGTAETFQESIHSIGFLILVTIFTIYVVLGILYESFIHPLTILSTLPPAIVGALLTLYIFGMSLSLYAYLGIIMLIGIVKKNGIMMIDFALDNVRTKGDTPEKSIFDACIVRFRPIMMTTFAAIMGAIPIALGIGASGESHRPLGLVIIGGMVVSQMITLFLTPVIYLYLEELRVKFQKKAS